MSEICEIVRENELNYTSGYTKKGKYVSRNMYDVIQNVDAYLFDTHLTGQTDTLNREKPFFNIVRAASNIWYRATDLDRKDCIILPSSSSQTAAAFAATALLQDWMVKEKFGHFLNDWGRTLARYGSSVVKFVKKDGRLIPSVVSWDNLIVDPIDFANNAVIEKFYLTPAQLRQNTNYDQEAVEQLLQKRSQSRENLEDQQTDLKAGYVEMFEVHLLGSLSYLTKKESDEKTYRDQMHVVCFLIDKDSNGNTTYNDYTLFSGKEERSPYMLTHLIEEPGFTLSMGAVESLFNAQWMVNHTIKQTRDYLDLASKLIYQTADTRFVGRNILTNIESGAILNHAANMPLAQVSNNVGNITALQSFGEQWKLLAQDITSTPDALRGNTLPSGTPYSLGAILQQQAGSLFEVMTENKGLYLEDMIREFIIPYLKTKMDTSDEIVAILDEKGIAEIDAMYVPREAIRRYNKQTLDLLERSIKEGTNEIPSPYQKDIFENEVRQDLGRLGNKRPLKPDEIASKTWKSVLKDLEWKVQVVITNEAIDKQAILTTLNSVLGSIGANPMLLNDPNAKLVFSEILRITGAISPIQISTAAANTPPMMGLPPLPASQGGGVPTPLSIGQPNG